MTIRKNKIQIFATFLIIALLWATIFCGSAYAVNVITIDKVIYGCSDIEQTWAQWCETTENTIGIYVDSRGYVKSADGYNIMADGGTAPDDFQLGTDKPADATHFVVYKDKTVIVPMYASLTAKSIDFDISEKITISSTGGSTDLTISDLEISNPRMSQPLIVENIEVSAAGAWKLVSAETDFTSIAANSNVFSMECGEHDFSDGKMLDGSIIENGNSKAYSFTGGTGKVTKNYSGNIGQVIVTVDTGNYVWGMSPEITAEYVSYNMGILTYQIKHDNPEVIKAISKDSFYNATLTFENGLVSTIDSAGFGAGYESELFSIEKYDSNTGTLSISGNITTGMNSNFTTVVTSPRYTVAAGSEDTYPNKIVLAGYYYELIYPQLGINFTINSIELAADNDMTWEAWCESDYNTIGAYTAPAEGGAIRYEADGMVYAVKKDNTTLVKKEETIISDHAYVVAEEGPAGK